MCVCVCVLWVCAVNTQYRDMITARLLLCCTGHSAKLINCTVYFTVGTNKTLYCLSCLADFRIYVLNSV